MKLFMLWMFISNMIMFIYVLIAGTELQKEILSKLENTETYVIMMEVGEGKDILVKDVNKFISDLPKGKEIVINLKGNMDYGKN